MLLSHDRQTTKSSGPAYRSRRRPLAPAASEPLERRVMLSGTITILASFNGTDGKLPSSIVLSGTTLYGTAEGGAYDEGQIFSLPITGGTPTTLVSFDGTDGVGNLLLSGSTLYGTAQLAGNNGDGEVFSLPIAGGTPTVLASFDGGAPITLIIAGETLYGCDNNTIFALPTTGGTPRVLATFDGTDGTAPGSLLLSGSTLYGSALEGGTNDDGTIFSLPASGGTPTVLADLAPRVEGEDPGGLVISGTTLFGSTNNEGPLTGNDAGTVFSLPTSGGTPTVLASIFGTGGMPGVILGNGSLYCATQVFPAVFSLPLTGGTPTMLAALNGSPGGLILSGNTLYGTMPQAGTDGQVFALGLAPTTISLTSSHITAYQGQQVTLTATVAAASGGSGTPTGTVTFYDNGAAIGAAIGAAEPLANGTASFSDTTLPIGTNSITATYSGDTNFASATTASALIATVQATTPTITSATASASTHGYTIAASVVGADTGPGGAAGLKYTWTAIDLPRGAKVPKFNINGTNAAKNIIARFSKDGGYVIQCEVKNAAGNAAFADVLVTVSQKATSLRIEPHDAHIAEDATQQYTGTVLDQFNHPMRAAQTLTFLLESGPGSIGPTGLLSATSIAGRVEIELEADGLTGTVAAVVG